MRRAIVALTILIVAAGTAAGLAYPAFQHWESQRSGTGARLRGLSVVSDRVAWASGSGGTVLRTIDGGRVWQKLSVPGGESLDFRDVDAMSATVAYLLSIGNGPASRIYKTTDGGATWTLQFQNSEPRAFFDAMAFWDERRGIAFSDSIDGQFYILRTENAGATWTRVPPDTLPPALDNEGAFAASGTNVAVAGEDHVWIATGAAARSRVLRSTDGGTTWSIADTPLASGPAAGAFSIAFRDTRHGVIVGGDIPGRDLTGRGWLPSSMSGEAREYHALSRALPWEHEDAAVDNAAYTTDGGRTWRPATGLSGYRSVVAPLPGGRGRRVWLALGPAGADVSTDDGKTWRQMASPGFDTLGIAPTDDAPAVFAAGANGRLGRLAFDAPGRDPR